MAGFLEKLAKIGNPLGSIISSGTGLLSSGISTIAQAIENKKNRTWQSAEAEKQRQWSSQEAELAFDRQQEYFDKNLSIGARIKNGMDAGLNAITAAGIDAGGGISSVPATAPAAPTASASPLPPTEIPDIVGKMLDLKYKEALTKNVDADTGKKEAETNATNLEAAWIDARNSKTIEQQDASIEQLKASASNLLKQNELIDSNIQKNTAAIDKMVADTAVAYDSLDTARVNRRKLQAEINALVDGLKTSAKQRDVWDKNMEKVAKDIEYLTAELAVIADPEYQNEKRWSIRIDNDNKEAETRYREAQELLLRLERKGTERYGYGTDDPFMQGLHYLSAICGAVGQLFKGSLNVSTSLDN